MRVLTILLTCLIIFAVSCKGAGSKYVAIVNGEKIPVAEFTAELRQAEARYDPKSLTDPKKKQAIQKDVFDKLVKERLLYTVAVKEGIKVPQKAIDQEISDFKSKYTEGSFRKMLELKGIDYSEWADSIKRSLYVDELLKQRIVSQMPISDSDIKKYYKSHRKEFGFGDQVHARQILVSDQKTADDLHKRLLKGENFAALAEEFSISPEGKRGGDLGWFERGVMPKIFDEACFPLPTGEISPVVSSEFGFHIFKVIERRNASTIPLEKVKEKIVHLIRQERMGESFDKWYQKQVDGADIKVYGYGETK